MAGDYLVEGSYARQILTYNDRSDRVIKNDHKMFSLPLSIYIEGGIAIYLCMSHIVIIIVSII